jgi:hypothetical protein
MKMIFITIPLLLVALVFSGCTDDATEEPVQSLEFATVAKSKGSSSISGIKEQRFVIVKDAATWETLWAEHTKNKPAPSIHFEQDMVLGVFLGTRGNSCFSVTIESVEQIAKKHLVVKYREEKSGPVCSQVEIQPFHLISLRSTTLPVEFVAQQ